MRRRTSSSSLRRQLLRTRREIHQYPFELIEQIDDAAVAGGERRLPIEAVGGDQLFGARALIRDIHGVLIVGAHDLDEHHLRPIEMVAEIDEQDPLRGDRSRRPPLHPPAVAAAGRP